jgi:hypothetical protein
MRERRRIVGLAVGVAAVLTTVGYAASPLMGAVDTGRRLAGTPDGPDGQPVPNLTPDPVTGIGGWDKSDLTTLLKTGITPEQTKVKGAMREAIDDGIKDLSDADLDAIADYVLAQPPIVREVTRRH